MGIRWVSLFKRKIFYFRVQLNLYIANSIKVSLGTGKLLFGGYYSKSLHCSIYPNAQCAITNDQLPIESNRI